MERWAVVGGLKLESRTVRVVDDDDDGDDDDDDVVLAGRGAGSRVWWGRVQRMRNGAGEDWKVVRERVKKSRRGGMTAVMDGDVRCEVE